MSIHDRIETVNVYPELTNEKDDGKLAPSYSEDEKASLEDGPKALAEDDDYTPNV